MAAKRSVLLTLDALDTLYYPRLPIAQQYLQVARNYRLPLALEANEAKVNAEFHRAFKAEQAQRPIYGYQEAQKGIHAGPKEWWGDVIRDCLRGVMESSTKEQQGGSASRDGIPEALVEELYERFNSDKAYALYDDVAPFFTEIQALRKSLRRADEGVNTPRIYVAVVSNSDGRVDNILRAFGLRVGNSSKQSRGEHTSSHAHDAVTSDDIDTVLTSYDVGYEKPHPKIFEIVANMAAHPQRMVECRGQWFLVHVGDHYRKDGEGAMLAGWDESLILQREAAVDPSQCDTTRPVTHTESLLEVLPLIKAALHRD